MFRQQCPHPYHQAKRQRLVERNWLLIVVVGLIAFFLLGRLSVKNTEEYEVENVALKASVERLTAVNKELAKQQDFIENAQKIDLQAKKESRHSLTKLHDELSAVKEQLAFYQRVVAPETLIKGLYINSFDIKHDIEKESYHYQLVLAQGASQKRAIKGKCTLSIFGRLNGVEKRLSLKEVSLDKTSSKSFSFRYYEILSGTIILPNGFVPIRVEAKITPSIKNAKVVEQQWAWVDTVGNN